MQTEKQGERLVELLKKADESASNKMITDYEEAIRDNADYLMSNNVVVLPCNVGDTVYYVIDLGSLVDARVLEMKILRVEITDEMKFYAKTVKKFRYNYAWFGSADFGKTVFLSREEAENVLKDRNNGD